MILHRRERDGGYAYITAKEPGRSKRGEDGSPSYPHAVWVREEEKEVPYRLAPSFALSLAE
jgi:hypothetical protein